MVPESPLHPQVSIIVPVFNERDNLVPLVEEIRAVMKTLPAPQNVYEIIAIDDGSRDGSTEVLRGMAKRFPEMKTIVFRRNTGQSAAFDAGFRYASGTRVISMDADLQNDPADIPRLLSTLEQGYDVVAGWRKSRQDTFWRRHIPSLIANWLVRRITGSRAHDLGCSLRGYRREILAGSRIYGEMHRFLCPILEMQGAKVAEITVHHRPRASGKSNYGLNRTFKVCLDLIFVWFQINYLSKPMYVFGSIGFAGIFAGSLVCFYTLYEKLTYGIFVHRNPLMLIGMGAMMIGFQFISVGLLAEVLVRTYFESQDKSTYAIAELIGLDRESGQSR